MCDHIPNQTVIRAVFFPRPISFSLFVQKFWTLQFHSDMQPRFISVISSKVNVLDDWRADSFPKKRTTWSTTGQNGMYEGLINGMNFSYVITMTSFLIHFIKRSLSTRKGFEIETIYEYSGFSQKYFLAL